MGAHAEGWLDRWREQEPVRLYLWTVASTVLAGCELAGWLTGTLVLAITGPVAAALMVGGTAAARREVYAPATVEEIQGQWQDHEDRALAEAVQEQHEVSWQDGWDAGVLAAEKAQQQVERTPEKVAEEVRPPAPPTTALGAQQPCGYVEESATDTGPRVRRCMLPRHPDTFGHRLEELGVQE